MRYPAMKLPEVSNNGAVIPVDTGDISSFSFSAGERQITCFPINFAASFRFVISSNLMITKFEVNYAFGSSIADDCSSFRKF